MRVLSFRELHWHHSPDGASLKDAVRPAPHPDRAGLLAYLRSGWCFAARPLVVPDYLRPEREMVSTSHWYTDGEWIWPTDLIYYVEEYHAELPAEFAARMASFGWSCPQLSQGEKCSVADWWVRWRETGGAERGAAPGRPRD